MKILIILSVMLVLCFLYGKLIAVLISRKVQPREILLQIGYAYFLVFFYLFYVALHSAYGAAYTTLLAPILAVGVARFWTHLRQPLRAVPDFNPPARRGNLPCLLSASILVAAFAIWPYLLCGWGNYWQAGIEDLEDGLNGRDAYLNGQVFDTQHDRGKILGDRSQADFEKITNTPSGQDDSYRARFAGDMFRFQYSSLALWSALFHEPFDMDILIEQELLDLLLMCAGVYFLCRCTFLMSPAAAAAAAGASVLSTFYLTTFFVGHIGSLMYGALAGAWMLLVIGNPAAKLGARATLAFCALITAAIGFSYPHPLAILAPPVLMYRLWTYPRTRLLLNKSRQLLAGRTLAYVLIWLLALVIIGVVMVGLWYVTAPYRMRQASQYRAWGFTHDWVIIPLFLGLLSPPVEGVTFLGATLPSASYWTLVGFAAALGVFLAICYCCFRPSAHRGFLMAFGAFWLPAFLVFRYFIVDSYYTYKFLYTQQFLLIIGIVGFFAGTRHRTLKFLGVAVLLVNLMTDLNISRAIYARPFNHASADLAELLRIDPAILRGSFVQIAGGEGVAVRQVLKAHGIETSLDPRVARYLIVQADRDSDITGAQLLTTVARVGSRLAIMKVPVRNDLLIRTRIEPESVFDPVLPATVFRWVGDGRDDNLGIYVIRPDPDDPSAGQYLRICFTAGPSDMRVIPLSVTTATHQLLAQLPLDGLRCVWLPSRSVLSAPQPLIIRSGAQGKSLLPHDDRILLYRVFDVGWTNEPYDQRAMSLFNVDHDITSGGSAHSVRLLLGQGWQPLENDGGKRFRWAGASPEVVLLPSPAAGVADVGLDLEPGPSYGPGPFTLAVEDSDGKTVFQSPAIFGRQTLRFSLKYAAGERSVYVLRCHSKHLALPKDPRELDFRVFHMTCGSKVSL